MKNTQTCSLAIRIIFVALAVSISPVSFAATKKHAQASAPTMDVTTYSRASESRSSAGEGETALGASTDFVLGASGVPTLTAVFDISSQEMVQVFLGVGGTSGVFQIGLGGLFKHTVTGSKALGLHIGGGFAYANISNGVGGSNSAITFAGVAGVHARFPGLERLALHFDAGPEVTIANSVTNFTLGALSPALGLSIVYYL